MILRSITPKNLGPFVAGAPLKIEPDVTVITGPNDAGKTMVLRAIELLCTSAKLKEHEANRDRLRESNDWANDSEIQCSGEFSLSDWEANQSALDPFTRGGATLAGVTRRLNKEKAGVESVYADPSDPGKSVRGITLVGSPAVLRLPLSSQVRQSIDLLDMSEAEDQFIKLAFGPGFGNLIHSNLHEESRLMAIHDAESNLNARLSKIFPSRPGYQFHLREGAQASKIQVSLMDGQRGFVPIESRGAGVRKLLSVIGSLLRVDPERGSTIILFDEPETSLHADAQHILRRLLEEIASHDNVQVVYTTHSPAMINTLRPQSLRVVNRTRHDDKATSVFINDAFDKNYLHVRTSLGMSPGDSLLFAPITIVAEGKSEVIGIPLLLEKLAGTNGIDKERLELLMSHIHIIDGEGSTFDKMCELALSQNVKVVTFLDGDKKKEWAKCSKRLPDVEGVMLGDHQEIEDLVPKSSYLEAVASLLGAKEGEMTMETFSEWKATKPAKADKMFSKWVEWWVHELGYDKAPPKHLTLKQAIENTPAEKITAAPIIDLFNTIDKLAKNL